MFVLNWRGRPLDNQKFGFSWTQLGFWIKNPSGKQQLLRSKFAEIPKLIKQQELMKLQVVQKLDFLRLKLEIRKHVQVTSQV